MGIFNFFKDLFFTEPTVEPIVQEKPDTLSGKIIKTPTEKSYLVDFDKKLGKGGFGTVYEAYPLASNKKNEKSRAVKVFSNKNNLQDIEAETHILKNYYNVEGPIKVDDSYYVFMDKIPGETLSTEKIKNLNFQERVALIQQYALWLNLFHHRTPSTGPVIAHSDIKESNRNI